MYSLIFIILFISHLNPKFLLLSVITSYAAFSNEGGVPLRERCTHLSILKQDGFRPG